MPEAASGLSNILETGHPPKNVEEHGNHQMILIMAHLKYLKIDHDLGNVLREP